MYISAVVNIKLEGLEHFKQAIAQQLSGTAGPVHDAVRLWAVRYRSFAQLRFDLYSKGGGDWQKLAVSTIKKRRQGTKSNLVKLRQIQALTSNPQKKDAQSNSNGGNVSILRDTGLLFAALTPVFAGAPGAIEENIQFGIRVGYGGPQRHAIGDKNSTVTIADIASFHQNGFMPRLPKRQIIVPPTQMLLSSMADDMTKALVKLAK